MDAADIHIVRATWARLRPDGEALIRRYFGRLFDLDPALRPLLEGDLNARVADCLCCLDEAVAALGQPGGLREVARRHGPRQFFFRRDAGNGHGDDFDHAGIALVWALERLLGPDFTLARRAAWAEFFGELSEAIREALPGG